jgi:hypothetical protein
LLFAFLRRRATGGPSALPEFRIGLGRRHEVEMWFGVGGIASGSKGLFLSATSISVFAAGCVIPSG